MRTKFTLFGYSILTPRTFTLLGIVFVLPLLLLSRPAIADDGDDESPTNERYCSATADLLLRACMAEMEDNYYLEKAVCTNIGATKERSACFAAAYQTKRNKRQECYDQNNARHALCQITSEERYEPEFTPTRFVDPDQIGFSIPQSPYFPLKVGTTWRYSGEGETVQVTVTNKIKVIQGVKCRVVSDIVHKNGQLVEDTDDWVAQDIDGNVWYCGERVMDFESHAEDKPIEPELIAIDGSFKAGRDGAKPGIWVKAYPQPGEAYRQEVAWANAEDAVIVTRIDGSEAVPAARCNGTCLVTREFTPLDPGKDAFKYYAPGVGLILEINATGQRLELIEFKQP